MKRYLIILSAILISSLCHADGYTYALTGEFSKLDPTIAQDQGLNESLSLWKVNVGYQKSMFRGDVTLGATWVKDEDSFDQLVSNGSSTEVRTSDAGGVNVGLEAGLAKKLVGFEFQLMAGIQKLLISRSIDDCLDCSIEQIEIPANTYLKPQVAYSFGPIGVGAAYVITPEDASIGNSIRFVLTSTY